MPEKTRTKKYRKNNRYADRHLLIRKLNDMMPIPDPFMTDIVLNLTLRLTALRSTLGLHQEGDRETLRQLVSDLVLAAAVARKLTLLFVNPEQILQSIVEATEAIQRLSLCYKESQNINPDDLDALEGFVDLYHSLMKQTRMDEYRKALEAASAELQS